MNVLGTVLKRFQYQKDTKEEKGALIAVSDMFQLENKNTYSNDPRKELVEKIEIVGKEKEKWTKISKALYAIEEDVLVMVKKKISELEKEEKALNAQMRFNRWYPRISLEPLKWRDEKGFPKLGLFSLLYKSFKISVVKKDGRLYLDQVGPTRSSLDLPIDIQACYEDMKDALGEHMSTEEHANVSIVATFKGVIPYNVRQQIEKARSDFLRYYDSRPQEADIFVLAETKFKINKEVFTPSDPLVVGFKEGALFLIADFETTSLEEAVVFYDDCS